MVDYSITKLNISNKKLTKLRNDIDKYPLTDQYARLSQVSIAKF